MTDKDVTSRNSGTLQIGSGNALGASTGSLSTNVGTLDLRRSVPSKEDKTPVSKAK